MIIYEANETDFFSNGLGTLPDATSALVTEERNGEFVLDVIYPQQGLRSELLTKNRIIKADASHELKDQRFVIKKVTPTMDSDGYIYLTVHAEHVSYITADLGVTPNLTLSGNATQALEQWQANLVGGHPDITVDSDIISEHETNLDITKATNARQVLGGVEGSILDVWGGEYKFDNLHISLRGQRGTTANTLISYGRNLLTFEQEDDITDTYTSIYPYANIGLADGNNSKLITVDEYFVDSQYVDRYPNRKLLPVDFSSEFTDYKIGSKPSESDTGIYTTEAGIKKKLAELAKQYIENNRIGIPKVSTKITFADLSKTSEYAPLEQVNLCDIIPIRFEKLGIDTTIKVTRVVWNVLLDEYDSIELGDLRTTLGDSISALESKTTGLANAVITAQSTADNQNSIFRTNGGTAEPVAKKVGDLWFKTDGDYQYMYQWDGAVWHEVVNTKTTDDIAKEVDKAKADAKVLSSEVESAKKQAQEAFAKAGFNADEISNVKTATSEVTETLTSTVRQASELSESLKDVASETASRYSTVSSELSGARESLTAKASELAKEVASNSANITKANSQLYSQSEGLAKVSQSATKMEQTMTDLSGRVHTVETTASETKEALADAKGNIATLTKRADGTDTKIADAQGRVQTLESRADSWDLELSKKVDNTTYNAGIQNLGNQINLKANKSDLDGYATKAQLSVESDRITQQASAISSVTTIANGANVKIDNLSFGGRNLLDNTDPTAFQKQDWNVFGQWWYGLGGNGTCTIETLNDSKYTAKHYFRIAGNTGGNRDFQQNFVPEDTTYTFSVKIRLYKDTNVYNPTILIRNFAQKDGIERNRYRTSVKGLSKDYWTNFSVTFSAHDIATVGGTASMQFGIVGAGSVEFLEPQLEKGNKPSDYSLSQNDLQRLASEDTASQISQYNTGTVQPIKGIANDALGKANSANDKIDGLRIGGRNLLKNSKGRFQPNSSKLDNFTIYEDTIAHLENGKTYTVSAKTKDGLVFSSVHEPTKQSNKIVLWMVDATQTYNVIVSDNKTNTVGTVLKWDYPTDTYRLRVNTYNSNNSGYAEDVQIQEGTRATEWQPSDLDLPATIVTTVTEVSNASQIVKSSGIYTDISKVRTETTGKIDTVNSRVSDVNNKVDNTNSRIDNLSFGGTNLINNSGNPKTTDRWRLSGTSNDNKLIVWSHLFWKNGQENLFALFNRDSKEVCMSSDWVKVERNTDYTLSYWAFADSNVVSSDTFFLGGKNGETSDFTVINKLVDSRQYSGAKAEYITVTFNTGEVDEGYIRFDNNGSKQVGKDAVLFLANIKLEKGNKASDWSMSQNDAQKLAHDDAASQINASITPISTTVNQYTHTTDNLANKVTDIFKDIGYDQEHHKFTDTFKSVVETAGGMKETYKELEGKIDGIVVGGKNLIDNSGDPQTTDGWWLGGISRDKSLRVGTHPLWKNGKENLFILYNSDKFYEDTMSSKYIKVERNTEYTLSYWAFADSNVVSSDTFFLGRKNGETSDFTVINKLVDSRQYSTAKAEYITVTFNTGDCDEGYLRFDNNRSDGTQSALYIANIQLEKGNKPSDWGMSDNDINKKISDANVSITKTNETIKTVDGNITTVKNNLDKTKSVVSQLANLFDVTVGDSSISVTNGGVLVKGKQISIDGDTYIKDASIDGAKIKSLDAGKITTGTLNAASVKVINLDANNIKTGTLTGPGMALDLNNGTFKINKLDNSLKVEMDSGKLRFYRLNGKLMGTVSSSDWTGLDDNNQALELSGKSGAVLKTENFKMTNTFMTSGWFLTTADVPSSNGSAVILRDNDVKIVGQTNSQISNSRIVMMAGKPYTCKLGGVTSVEYTGIDIIGSEDQSGVVDINAGSEVRISGSRNKINLNLGGSSIEASVANSSNYDDKTRESKIIMREDAIYFDFTKDKEDLTPLALYNGGTVRVKDLSVWGSKNAIVQTTAGWTKINAYETAEYYFGDLGTAITDDTSTVRIGIEPLFNETVNTDIPYQVFVTSYGKGYAWVTERGSNYFVIKSSVPNLEIGYEIKAKRKGYENVRLEIDKHMEVNKQ